MSRRAVKWIAGLGVLDLLVLALTIHANLTFHRTATSPSVMPLGELLGWIVFGLLFAAVLVIVKESRR